ncbi:terminase small subunit protein [Bradyrhizobium sp. SZCCHNR2032]|uniref:terminase small subunit-like protein n=1 Tax=Bradyrhizobium sp. SZCCHNR2032 TaxID=3057384 RepID=UPI003967B2DD
MARPSDYSPDIVAMICARMSEGESLRSICRDDSMPDKSTVFRWLAAHAEFRDQYARAREARTDAMAEEILEISDDGSNDTYEVDGREVTNQDVIARSRLRVDTRKWLMARMAPKKYGDRLEQVLTGDPEKPVETITRIELVPAGMPDNGNGKT